MMVQVSNSVHVDAMFGGSISENNINDSINIDSDNNIKLSQIQSFHATVIVNNNNNNNNNDLILDLESCLLHKFGILTVGYNGYVTSNNWDPSLSKGGKLVTECG